MEVEKKKRKRKKKTRREKLTYVDCGVMSEEI